MSGSGMISRSDHVMHKWYHMLIGIRGYNPGKASSSAIRRNRSVVQSLANLRVIDLSHVIAGPAASHYLAAFGAEVIKIENPRAPDVMRYVDAGPDEGISTTFAALNA